MNWLIDAQLPRWLPEQLRALITGLPPKLLWVTVGNISNIELLTLFESVMPELQIAFAEFNCIELTVTGLVVHQ